MISTGSLIAAGLVAAGSAGMSAYNRSKAKKEEARSYQNAREYLDSMYYRDPLTTVGNRSLLKAAEKNYQDNLEAINNRMIAGGATMENQLAARQANNESRDKMYGQLLMNEDARRDRINQQKIGLDQQHSSNVQNNYLASAQDWSQWGQQTAGALLSYGSSGLLNGAGAGGGELSAAEWALQAPEGVDLAMANRTENSLFNPIMQPVTSPKKIQQGLGGLAGQ